MSSDWIQLVILSTFTVDLPTVLVIGYTFTQLSLVQLWRFCGLNQCHYTLLLLCWSQINCHKICTSFLGTEHSSLKAVLEPRKKLVIATDLYKLYYEVSMWYVNKSIVKVMENSMYWFSNAFSFSFSLGWTMESIPYETLRRLRIQLGRKRLCLILKALLSRI